MSFKPASIAAAVVVASAAALAAAPAHAGLYFETVDFEDPALVGLYVDGQSFVQGGFRMTTSYDFGLVDTVAALPVPVGGNTSNFYFQSNDGGLEITRDDGRPFELLGLRASFAPATTGAPLGTFLVAYGVDTGGNVLAEGLAFPPASGGTYAFGAYDAPGDFVGAQLDSLLFFACSRTGCSAPTFNTGQFALDDLRFAVVPEPASLALTLGALLAGAAGARRRSVG